MKITIFWNIIGHFLSLPISFKFSVKILASSNLTVNSLPLCALAYSQKQKHEFVRYFEWYSKHVILWKLRILTNKGWTKKNLPKFFTITRSNFTQIKKSWTFLNSSSSWLLKNAAKRTRQHAGNMSSTVCASSMNKSLDLTPI